jgi:hypothetical protein
MKHEASVVALPQITKHDLASDPVGEEQACDAWSIPKEGGVMDGAPVAMDEDEVRKEEEREGARGVSEKRGRRGLTG